MNIRTMATAASVLMAVCLPAAAQTSPSGPTVRDILNRAQTQSERRAVEDLIGKLRTNQPPAAPQGAPDSPAPAAEPQAAAPNSSQPQVAAPAAPAQAAPAVPAAVARPDPAAVPVAAPPVAAAAPASAPPVVAAPPTRRQQPVAVTQPAGPAIGPASSGVAAGPASTATANTPNQAPNAAAPNASTRVSAPQGPAARDNRRTARPARSPRQGQPPTPATAANETGNVGAPIGPAEAVPTPIGPSDAEMARAPEIARERGLPTVDIEVLFDYDSDQVSPAAAEGLMSLGRALTDPRLAGQKFVIGGHTDAKGAARYNLGLSDRRAQAVRTFLVEHFKVAPENLIARGYGETRLKNPANPLGPENRRVQVINWTGQLVDQRRR